MRWPWQRQRPEPDPKATAAAYAATERLRAVEQRQPAVDWVAARLAELGEHNHFAEAVEAAMRRPR